MTNTNLPAPATPAWLQQARLAVQRAVKADDIAAIVRKQVELAKGGDATAARFVFDYALGGRTTIVVNTFDAPPADEPEDVPAEADVSTAAEEPAPEQPAAPEPPRAYRVQHEAGVAAGKAGEAMSANPHPITDSEKRQAWAEGWRVGRAQRASKSA